MVLRFSNHTAVYYWRVFLAGADAASCSHSRAHDVYTETINGQTCQFVGYPCESYVCNLPTFNFYINIHKLRTLLRIFYLIYCTNTLIH